MICYSKEIIDLFSASDNERISEAVTLEPTISQDDLEGRLYIFNDTYANDRVVATVQEKGALAAIEVGVAFGKLNLNINQIKYHIILI